MMGWKHRESAASQLRKHQQLASRDDTRYKQDELSTQMKLVSFDPATTVQHHFSLNPSVRSCNRIFAQAPCVWFRVGDRGHVGGS